MGHLQICVLDCEVVHWMTVNMSMHNWIILSLFRVFSKSITFNEAAWVDQQIWDLSDKHHHLLFRFLETYRMLAMLVIWIILWCSTIPQRTCISTYLFPDLSNTTMAMVSPCTVCYDSIPSGGFCNVPLLRFLYLYKAFKPSIHILHLDSFRCLSQLTYLQLEGNGIEQLPFGVFRSLEALEHLELKGLYKSIM